MKATRVLGRILVPVSWLLLAACQTVPGKKGATSSSQAEPQTSPAQAETTIQAQGQGAPVAVYLANTTLQPGWASVALQSGTLHVHSQPVIPSADLSGDQAGQDGRGSGRDSVGQDGKIQVEAGEIK